MKKFIVSFLTTCLCITALAGCGKADEAGLTKVTLSEVVHSIFYAPQYVAMELGFFEEEGIDLQVDLGNGADKCMTALLSGNADIALCGTEAALYIHAEGRDDELPWVGMMRTTVVAKACRLVRLENGPAIFQMPLTGLAIGPVAMVGIPGEPFTGVGRALKEAPDWALVLPTCNTNAKEGYFPMLECYQEGGYEAGGSNYKAGVAEILIDAGLSMLEELK